MASDDGDPSPDGAPSAGDGTAPAPDGDGTASGRDGVAPDEDGVTPARRACFEAGIKFGSLYHQFAGTPVSPASARSLERAMAEAIENQPACETVAVTILEDRLRAAIEEGGADYAELTGEFMEVRMRIRHEGVTVRTRMELTDGYPLMRLEAVE